MSDQATARLCAHKPGSYKCSEDKVRSIIAPEATSTWHPISHGRLLDVVNAEIETRGLSVSTKDFALGKGDARMFSVYNLASTRPGSDFTLALGIRNSTDKSLPAGLCVGSRVFVCDNLMFSAEIVIKRKHTPGIERDLPMMIQQAFSRVKNAEIKQNEQFEYWKSLQSSDTQASDTIVRLAKSGLVPVASIVGIRDEFIKPRFAEFEGKTVWSLYNACSTVLRHDRKEVEPIRRADALLGIHNAIALEYALASN